MDPRAVQAAATAAAAQAEERRRDAARAERLLAEAADLSADMSVRAAPPAVDGAATADAARAAVEALKQLVKTAHGEAVRAQETSTRMQLRLRAIEAKKDGA